ncbi:MAG: hypothetical protein IJY53_02630 [Akkermansia sp.]|nr:hypothetical protein [Akkermansia sp.]
MIKKLILSAMILVGIGVSCVNTPKNTAYPHTPALKAPAIPQADSFAIQAFSTLAAAQQEDNLAFSPAGLEAVLHLLQQGAQGSTAAELAALPLGKKGVYSAMQPAEAYALFVADDLTLTPGVRTELVQRMPFASAPGKAAKAINEWAKRQTHGLISNVVDAVSPATRLIAASAIYLKEKWLHPFDKGETESFYRFTCNNGSTTYVDMMQCTEAFRYAEGEDWQAVALPYKTEGRIGEPGYFIGILPKGNAHQFAAQLTPKKYQSIRRALAREDSTQTLLVKLPRFRIDTGRMQLNELLQVLGVKKAFTREADFRGFAKEPLYLNDVSQYCVVINDEEGTEAAAVTVADIDSWCLEPEQPQIKELIFDRPFLWIIGDLTTPAPPYFMGITATP